MKLCSCPTQLSIKLQLLINAQMSFLALRLLEVVFIMLINIKMPTIDGILTFVSMIDLMFKRVEDEKSLIIIRIKRDDKLELFHANQTSMCLDPHQK